MRASALSAPVALVWRAARLVASTDSALEASSIKCESIDFYQPLALTDLLKSIMNCPSIHAISEPTMVPIATQAQLKEPRDLLADRWLDLRAGLHADEQAQRETTEAATQEVTDRKDEAVQRLRSDLEGAQEQRDMDEMAQVEAALHRLESGIYGVCTDCAEPIAPSRLQVQPAAQRCAPCQTAYEQALDRSGPRRAE